MTDDIKNTAETSEDSTEQDKKAKDKEAEERKKHDEFVKFVLKNPRTMFSLIESYVDLNGLVDDIDPDSIVFFSETTISNTMKELRSDNVIMYKSKSNPSRKYSFLILIEHQTKPQRFMAFRNVEYIIALLRQLINQQLDLTNYILPYPIVILIHQGNTWDYLSMNELFGKTKHNALTTPPLLYLPEFFIDLSKIQPDEYKGTPEIKCLFCTIQSRTMGNFEQQLDFLIPQLKQFESEEYLDEYLLALTSYAIGFIKNDSIQYLIDRLSEVLPKEKVQHMFVSIRDDMRAMAEAEYEAKAEVKIQKAEALVDQEKARAEQEKARADQAKARAEQEKARAEQEKARADKAEAILRMHGLDPNTGNAI